MIKKTILYFWSLRREFAKYFIIGITAFICDVGTLYILKEWAHLTPTQAVIINQPPITLLVFYLNKRWSFRAGGMTHVQMVRFYLLAALNYTISVGWIHVMHEWLNIQYILARTANIALAVMWNFLLYKYWVFRVVPVPENSISAKTP